jgi:hypothetical protein
MAMVTPPQKGVKGHDKAADVDPWRWRRMACSGGAWERGRCLMMVFKLRQKDKQRFEANLLRNAVTHCTVAIELKVTVSFGDTNATWLVQMNDYCGDMKMKSTESVNVN